MANQQETAGRAVHCVIHTPLAYLCLREYLALYPYAERFLYVLASSPTSAHQIEELCRADRWSGFEVLGKGRESGLVGKAKALLDLVARRRKLSAMLARMRPQDDLVLTHLRNPYARWIVKHRKGKRPIIAIDEGTTTLVEFEILSEHGRITLKNSAQRFPTIFKKIENRMFSSRDIESRQLAFFSFWPLDVLATPRSPQVFGTNPLALIRQTRRAKMQSREAFVFGQPFVRAGHLSAADYASILDDIADHYAQRGVRMVYFPHRNEDAGPDPEKYEIRRLSEPFELYYMRSPERPAFIGGFFSAAMLTTYYLDGKDLVFDFFWQYEQLQEKRAQNRQIEMLVAHELANGAQFTIHEG